MTRLIVKYTVCLMLLVVLSIFGSNTALAGIHLKSVTLSGQGKQKNKETKFIIDQQQYEQAVLAQKEKEFNDLVEQLSSSPADRELTIEGLEARVRDCEVLMQLGLELGKSTVDFSVVYVRSLKRLAIHLLNMLQTIPFDESNREMIANVNAELISVMKKLGLLSDGHIISATIQQLIKDRSVYNSMIQLLNQNIQNLDSKKEDAIEELIDLIQNQ